MANNKNDLDELMNLDSDDNNDINDSMNDLMNLDSQIEEDINENISDLENLDSLDDNDMMKDLMNLDEDNSNNDDDIMNDLMNLDEDKTNDDNDIMNDLMNLDSQDDEFLDINTDSTDNEINEDINIQENENTQNEFENIEFMEENSVSEDESLMPEDDLSSLGLAPIDNDEYLETETLVENEINNTEKKASDIENGIDVQKKKPKYFKYIIIAIASLGSLALVLTVLTFMGFFEKKVEEKKESQKEIVKIVKKYKFDIKDINVARLNKKLNLLTKYEIIETEDPQIKINEQKDYQKTLEEKNEELSKKNKTYENSAKIKDNELKTLRNTLEKNNQELREKLLKTKEELLNTKIRQENLIRKNLEEIKASEKSEEIKKEIEIKVNKKEEIKIVEKEKQIIKENIFLSFIKIKTSNSVIYKSLIDKIELVNKNIELCRDHNNKIEILIGPFTEQSKRSAVLVSLEKTIKNKAFKMDLTNEEFNKRCKY